MSGAKYSVLVIDDEQGVVESVANYLIQVARQNRDDLKVHRAYSAAGAQRVLAEHPVDVVFADYHFPAGMSGDQLIDKIEDPFGNKLIIMMSAWDEKELGGVITKRHKNLGPRFKFLRKPFEELEIKAKYLEMEQFFCNQPLPFPLAYAKQSHATSRTGPERILAIKDLIESLTKYCVAVIMSDLDGLGALSGLRLTFRPYQGLTLGAWLQWLEEALDVYAQSHTHAYMPELIQLFESGGGGSASGGHLRMMYEFKKYRDEEFAHGFKTDDGRYASVADQFEQRLKPLLDQLCFMTRYTLFTPERYEFAGDDEPQGFEYDVRVLMGPGTVFDQGGLQSSLRFHSGQVYSYGPSHACLPLSPFFIYRMCETCGIQRFFMLDGIKPTLLEYKAICNHRHVDKNVGATFKRLLGGLRPPLS